MKKRIMIPPRLGGGDVVMRECLTGEHEERLKRSAGASWVDIKAEETCASIVTFRGKALPVGADREEWWRNTTAALRQFLIGCVNALNSSSDAEIADFFGAAEVVKD